MSRWASRSLLASLVCASSLIPAVASAEGKTEAKKAPVITKSIDFTSLPEGSPEPTFSPSRPGVVHAGDSVNSFTSRAGGTAPHPPTSARQRTSKRGRGGANDRLARVEPTPALINPYVTLTASSSARGNRCLSDLSAPANYRATTMTLYPTPLKDTVPIRAEWLEIDDDHASLEIQDAWVDLSLSAAKEAGRQSIPLKLVALGPSKDPIYAFRSGSTLHLVFPTENNASAVLDSGAGTTSVCSMMRVSLDVSRGKSSVVTGNFVGARVLPWSPSGEEAQARSFSPLTLFASASQTASDAVPVLSVVVSDPSFDPEEANQPRKNRRRIEPEPEMMIED